MKKNQSYWDNFIFIFFQIQKNNFQDITKIHRSKFHSPEFEKLGLSYVSLFDRSDSSGTYEAIIQNRLQKLSSDENKYLSNNKGEGIYGLESKSSIEKMNKVIIETKQHFKTLDNVIFTKDFSFFNIDDRQFAKVINNIHYTYSSFIKYSILDRNEHIENLETIKEWVDLSKNNIPQCKVLIASTLKILIGNGIELVKKLNMPHLICKLVKQDLFLDSVIDNNKSLHPDI